MQPTIARWHTQYRVAGDAGNVARMESVVREQVVDAYAEALEQTFGGDPAVYVLRHVRTDLTLVNPAVAEEAAIARAWGGRTCAAVVRTLMQHGDDPSLVMRFDDLAAFIAQWIADLLDGVAWNRWYYGAFAAYRELAIAEALRRTLIDHRQHLVPILRRLEVMQRMPALLAHLPPSVAQELWRAAVRDEPQDGVSNEQFRPFVRAAIEIATALRLWWRDTPAQAQELFEEYVATAPRAVDWKLPRELAHAVLAVLTFLATRGDVRVDRVPGEQCREAVAAFEWLDVEWLAAALEAWLHAAPDEVTIAARPPDPTPLQRRIMAVLRELMAAKRADGSPADREPLALLAALAAAEPQLASHPAAPAAIEAFLRESPRAETTSATIIESAFAGVLLLSRAMIDARLTRLAEVHGVAVPGLLLALADEWHADPRDPGLVFWSGAEGEPEPLDRDALEALRMEIIRFMRQRAAFAPSLEPDEGASIASQLLRLWTHWLPGLAQSSGDWLLQQCILRPGVLRIDTNTVAVSLRSGPIDVVLEMAGYLAPIAAVPWLGDRRITFTTRSSA